MWNTGNQFVFPLKRAYVVCFCGFSLNSCVYNAVKSRKLYNNLIPTQYHSIRETSVNFLNSAKFVAVAWLIVTVKFVNFYFVF